MSDITTPAEHYSQMLAQVLGDVPVAQVLLPLEIGDPDQLEATNAEVGDRYEAIELGPYVGNRYLRLRGTDLVVFFDRLREVADDAICALIEERERKAEAERHDCFCGTRLDPDDETCGRDACVRERSAEIAYESLGLL